MFLIDNGVLGNVLIDNAAVDSMLRAALRFLGCLFLRMQIDCWRFMTH